MKNLTEGNPVKLMLSFALPVCIGNIFSCFTVWQIPEL